MFQTQYDFLDIGVSTISPFYNEAKNYFNLTKHEIANLKMWNTSSDIMFSLKIYIKSQEGIWMKLTENGIKTSELEKKSNFIMKCI